MPQIGPAEILVILFVALLVFGPTRLPETARQVGRALHEVRRFQSRLGDELHAVVHEHAETERPTTAASWGED